MSKKAISKKGYRNLDGRLKVAAISILLLEVSIALVAKRAELADRQTLEAFARLRTEVEEASARTRLLEAYTCERDGDEVVAERLAQIKRRELDAFLERLGFKREEKSPC